MKNDFAYYIAKAVPALFFLLIFIIPFHTGATPRYLLTGILDTCCLFLFVRQKTDSKHNIYVSVKTLLSIPLFWCMTLMFATVLLSFFFTPDLARAVRATAEEFFLNFITFFIVTLYAAWYGETTNWISGFILVNCIFAAVYAGIMLQWAISSEQMWFADPDILSPNTLWWLPKDITLKEASGVDRLLSFGDGTTLFDGIKHTSLYLTLFIAIAITSISFKHNMRISMVLLLSDLLLVVSTTKRGVMAAILTGMGAMTLFFPHMRRYTVTGTLCMASVILVVLFSGYEKYLVREDWSFIIKGEIRKAEQKKGSIPSRICAYREFVSDLAEHLFRGVGPVRRNLRIVYAKTVEKCGLQHGHNAFLNMGLYIGIQGMLLLVAIIFFQARIMLRCWQKGRYERDRHLALSILLFMIIFWCGNMFMDGFRHGPALLYWLVTAVATGRSIASTI